MKTMKTSSCLLACLSTTRQLRCVDAKAIATTPSSSLALLCCTLLCWGGWGEDDDDDDDLGGYDNARGVQPRPPNTQQPAIAGGEEGNDKDNKEESKLGKGR